MNRWQRISDHWVYGGFAFSFVLLVFLVSFAGSLELIEFLLCLHLPAYMWHQYEEHDDDRFRDFVDRVFGEGILRQNAIFVINVFGVWMLFSIFILIALLYSSGWALGVAYATLVNALVHLAQFIKLRSYNPGLITALVLFLPLSGFCLWETFKAEEFTVWHHVFGLSVGLGIHALIVIYAWTQAMKRKKNADSPMADS